MALPKIKHALFEIEVPSSKKKVKFRRILWGDEKILLMAKESGEETDILTAIKQIITNCCASEINVDTQLAIFDIEWLFMRLRASSVDSVAHVAFRDKEDEKIYEFDIDLDKVEVRWPEASKNNVVKITDNIGVQLRYSTGKEYDDREFLTVSDPFNLMVLRCIEKIYEDDNVIDTKDCPEEELVEFVNSIPSNIFGNIAAFVANQPSLYHEIKYTNTLGKEKTIVLSTLQDFFTF